MTFLKMQIGSMCMYGSLNFEHDGLVQAYRSGPINHGLSAQEEAVAHSLPPHLSLLCPALAKLIWFLKRVSL